ncbi:hypothetical protein HDU81_002853 [Chytriomyces hyalinus]|nr:hypothetical protein HDU81_002853 [Chytriomyces hyalinus]
MGTIEEGNANYADQPVVRQPTTEMQALMDETLFGDQPESRQATADLQDHTALRNAITEIQDQTGRKDQTESRIATAQFQTPMDEDEDLFGDDDENEFGPHPIHADASDTQESTAVILDSTPDKEFTTAPAAEPHSGGFSVELLDSEDDMDVDFLVNHDQAPEFEPSRTAEVDQVLNRIPKLFRILELYKDSGCSGLVDKIIIAQESVKELCNQLIPGSFKSISSVDFQRLSEVKMKLVGVYGNRESLAAMLLKLDAIDQQIFEMLTDAVSNSETSWLKPGLYFFLMKPSTGIVMLWPEQGCFYDDASSDLKKNLVNLHSFMYKLTHTQICLLSREDVNSINWEASSAVNEKDDYEMDFDGAFDVDNGGIFEFKVTKNQEKERNFRIRDGFRVTHRAICSSLDPVVPAPSRQQLAFITTQSLPSQRIMKKFDENYAPDDLRQFLKGQTLSTLRFAASINRDEFRKFVNFLYPCMLDKELILQPLDEFDADLVKQLEKFRADQETAMDVELTAFKAFREVRIKIVLQKLYPSLESMLSAQENARSSDSSITTAESTSTAAQIQTQSGESDFEHRKPALLAPDEFAMQAKLASINQPKWKAIKERLMLSEIYSSHLARVSPDTNSTKTLIAMFVNSRNRTMDNVQRACAKRLEQVTGVSSFNLLAKVTAFVLHGPPTDAAGWVRYLKDELNTQLKQTSDSEFVERAVELINATISSCNGIDASGGASDRKVETSHVDVGAIAAKLTGPAEDTYGSRARMAIPICAPKGAGGQCEVPTAPTDSTSPGHSAEETKSDLKMLDFYDLQAGGPVSIQMPPAEFSKLTVEDKIILRCKTILVEVLLAYSEWRTGLLADGQFLPSITKTRDVINARVLHYRNELIQKGLPAALAASKQILEARFGIGRLILIKSVGDERCHFSRYPSPRKKIHVAFDMEMSKPALVKYSVWKGNLDANDAKTLEAGEGNETFVPTPRFTSHDQIDFEIDPQLFQFRRAYILKNGNVLLFLQEIQSSYTLAITGSQNLRHRVENSFALKTFKRPISHISFDESKSLLAQYDSDAASLNVMCFDEGFNELFIKHPQINIGAWYNDVSPDIFDVIFIPTSEEVCFVEKSGKVRIYSLVTTEFRPSAFVLPPGFIRIIATNDGSCLMAIVQPIPPEASTETNVIDEGSSPISQSACMTETNEACEYPARFLEAHIFFCTQPTSAADIIVPLPSSFTPEAARSVEMIHVRNRQLHLTAVDNGAYVSVIAEISLERHCWQFQENRKVTPGKVFTGDAQISNDDLMVVIGRGTQFLNDARVDDHIVIANNERRRITAITSDAVLMVDRPVTSTQNVFLEYRIERRAGRGGLLDVYKNVFTKFPVKSCLDRDAPSKDRKFIAAIPIGAQFSCEDVGKYCHLLQRHIKNSFEDLRKITTKDTRSLNNMAVSLDGYSDISCFISAICENSEVQTFGDWLVRAFCLIPIQISMATQNRFMPLRDGVVSQEVEQPDIGSISEAISFGWYESIISYYSNYQVKVVSSMGEQSSGKSFMLNHLLGTSFDGSAMRCTEGAWMSMIPKHESKTIYVGLDFEGLQSIERSHQEDAILTVFNCATSSLVLMKTNFTIGRDANAMFSRFQDGANLFDAQNGKKLFTSKLALIIKDVAPADREGVVTEFKYKIAEMVAREGEDNFITRLHGNGVAIVPYPIFNDLAFFTHLIKLQNMLDAQKCKYQNALIFSKSIKVLMAKLKVCDWSGLDANLINIRCAQLLLAMPCAVGMGLEEMEPYPEALKNKDTGTEIADSIDSDPREDHEKVEDGAALIHLHQLDTGLKLYEVMELSANKEMTPAAFVELLANFVSMFDSKNPRSSASSDIDWFKEFCKVLTQLVDRRSKRVQDWLAQNTERFPADNVEVTNLSYTFEQSLTQLKLVWTLLDMKEIIFAQYRPIFAENRVSTKAAEIVRRRAANSRITKETIYVNLEPISAAHLVRSKMLKIPI